MNKQISKVIKFILNNHNVECTDNKHLMIEINDNNKFDGGNIKIDATGSWIKDFCIRKFKYEVWGQSSKMVYVHCGESSTQTYEIYKVSENIILGLEQEPFIEDCEYYLSFVFDIPKRTLLNKFPVIKKYIKDIADEHTDIKIKITGSDEYWKEDEKITKCIKLIGECITTIMIYDSTNNCRDSVQKYFEVSTKDAALEKIEKVLSQRILQYSEDDSK